MQVVQRVARGLDFRHIFIAHASVLFCHLTYLVYLTVGYEHMTLPRGKLC